MADRYSTSRSKRLNRRSSSFQANDLSPEAAQQVENFVDVLAGLLTDPNTVSSAAVSSAPVSSEPVVEPSQPPEKGQAAPPALGSRTAPVTSTPITPGVQSSQALQDDQLASEPRPIEGETTAAPEPKTLHLETPSRTIQPSRLTQPVSPMQAEPVVGNSELRDRDDVISASTEGDAPVLEPLDPKMATLGATPVQPANPTSSVVRADSSALVLSSTPTAPSQSASDVNVQATSAGEELNQLRTLLVDMEARFYDPDKLVKLLLPGVAEAMRERLKARQSVIANVLRSEMAMPLQEQIAIERDTIIDALYPVIGSTVAEYFTETLRTINRRVANTATAGQEIDLASGLTSGEDKGTSADAVATVRALFLVHRSTGLCLAKVLASRNMAASVETQTEMLTSIRSFADAILGPATAETATKTRKHRQGQILLEVADTCYLAAIVKGDPPVSFLRQMRQVLDEIATDYRDMISAFEGNVEAVPEDFAQRLKQLLNAHGGTHKRRRPLQLAGFGVLLLGVVAASVWGWQEFRVRQAAAFSDDVQRTAALLNQGSGIAITAETVEKQVVVEGEVLQFNDVQDVIQSFEQITGVEAVIDRIEAKPSTLPTRIYFYTGSTVISPRDIAGKISDVGVLLDENSEYRLWVVGYQNPTAEAETPNLGLERALAVADVLADQGIARERLNTLTREGVPPGVNVEFQPWLSQAVLFEIERPKQEE